MPYSKFLFKYFTRPALPAFFYTMGRSFSYISSAAAIVDAYKAEQPFNYFIKNFFASNKKFGSRDRKLISNFCYCYFRTFHLFKNEKRLDAIVKGFFLCENTESSILNELAPELNAIVGLPVVQKINYLKLDTTEIVPFAQELGGVQSPIKFAASFLRQPLLFLRMRPGKAPAVVAKIRSANLPFEQLTPDCLVMPNASSLEKIVRLNEAAVIQDFSSQRVFDFLQNLPSITAGNDKLRVWDCCAASGGKSILLFDILKGKLQLTVSDIRKTILHNLEERLAQARVPIQKKIVANLEEQLPPGTMGDFDLIICDVPCTGSGTWSRTPEQLAFYKNESILQYAKKQKAIASNAARYLKPGGLLFYITCSVFKKENETLVESLQRSSSLMLLHQHYLEGYEMQADTMFVAVLQK